MRTKKGFNRIPFVVASLLLAIMIIVVYFSGFDGILSGVLGSFNETASSAGSAP